MVRFQHEAFQQMQCNGLRIRTIWDNSRLWRLIHLGLENSGMTFLLLTKRVPVKLASKDEEPSRFPDEDGVRSDNVHLHSKVCPFSRCGPSLNYPSTKKSNPISVFVVRRDFQSFFWNKLVNSTTQKYSTFSWPQSEHRRENWFFLFFWNQQ